MCLGVLGRPWGPQVPWCEVAGQPEEGPGASGVGKAPPATHPCHHGAAKQDRAPGPALVPWGLSVRAGRDQGSFSCPRSALASPGWPSTGWPFLVLAFVSPHGAVLTQPCKERPLQPPERPWAQSAPRA